MQRTTRSILEAAGIAQSCPTGLTPTGWEKAAGAAEERAPRLHRRCRQWYHRRCTRFQSRGWKRSSGGWQMSGRGRVTAKRPVLQTKTPPSTCRQTRWSVWGKATSMPTTAATTNSLDGEYSDARSVHCSIVCCRKGNCAVFKHAERRTSTRVSGFFAEAKKKNLKKRKRRIKHWCMYKLAIVINKLAQTENVGRLSRPAKERGNIPKNARPQIVRPCSSTAGPPLGNCQRSLCG